MVVSIDQGPCLSTVGVLYRSYLLSLHTFLHISAKVIPVGAWEPHISLVSGTLQWLSSISLPPCYIFSFDFLTLCIALQSPPVPDTDTHYYLPILSPRSPLPPPPSITLFSPQCRIEISILWYSLFLSSIWLWVIS